MLRNYLKIALRTLWRNWLYALLNASGLAVGVAVVLLSLLYTHDEWRFDRFHRAHPHLYRITTTGIENRGDQPETTGGTGQVQGPTFAARVPEIETFVRVMGGDIYENLRTGDKVLKVQPLYVDSTFLRVFSFPLLHGNLKTALRDVGSVVVTARTARRFFNRVNVVGEVFHLDSDPSAQRLGKPVVISAVVQDPPAHSSLQFDVLHPFPFLQLSFDDTNWLNAYLSTFVVLHPTANPRAVERKMADLYAIHAKKQVAESRRLAQHDPRIRYGLQPLTDLHLHPLDQTNSNREGGIINGSNPVFSYLFLGIAGFILLMSSINFINLSIAGSLQRAKEVGVRKVSGGLRRQIIAQSLIESGLLCALALALGVGLVRVVLPAFQTLTEKQLAFGDFPLGWLVAGLLGLFVLLVLLAGFYPAWVLSRFKPTTVLYNRQSISVRGRFGRGLVVVQFALAFFLLVSTIVLYRQLEFIRTKDLGYNPFHVIRTYVAGNTPVSPVQAFLRRRLAHEPSIHSIAFGGDFGVNETTVNGKTVRSFYQVADEAYLATLGHTLRVGRNFSRQFPTDAHTALLVNEAFVKAAQLPNPLGATVRLDSGRFKTPHTIVGVVRDFHTGSLRERIQPVVMLMADSDAGAIWVKLQKSRLREGMAVLENAYREVLPQAVYDAQFLDELNAREYRQEQRWQTLLSYAAGLSVLICSFGLFGLAHLAAQQRTKEIGVRKVLGASVASIVALLSKDFLGLVVMAVVLATPLAWYVLESWLQNFAYRIDLNGWVFAAAGLLAVGVALLTVSFQSVKAALMNPVNALRSE
jgi:putative ABC transport system permease protein